MTVQAWEGGAAKEAGCTHQLLCCWANTILLLYRQQAITAVLETACSGQDRLPRNAHENFRDLDVMPLLVGQHRATRRIDSPVGATTGGAAAAAVAATAAALEELLQRFRRTRGGLLVLVLVLVRLLASTRMLHGDACILTQQRMRVLRQETSSSSSSM